MSKQKLFITTCAAAFLLGTTAVGFAHFGAVIPSDDIVTQEDGKKLGLDVKFIHPMEGQFMEMEKPKQFGVMLGGEKTDLLASLAAKKGKSAEQQQDFTYWHGDYQIKKPGDYTFFVEPVPYWEPAEDVFIIHYTKVCVNALGLEEGWDEPVGLETEIIPLTRPYGLWRGNIFTGQVLVQGKPVANAEVEVEYLNATAGKGKKLKAPSDPYITQVVKADSNGVFSYAMPKAGWWGFAALSEASWKMKKDDVEKSIEIGAVYWVHTVDLQ
jgi:cobalt/nickel transport protein